MSFPSFESFASTSWRVSRYAYFRAERG